MKAVKKSYDKEAKKYSPLMFEEKEFYKTNKSFLDLIKKQNKKDVLDVGCGPGLHSFYLSKRGFNVTALDFSPKMIKEARKNLKDINVKIILADLNKYKFKKKFGAIWATASLHNMRLKILKKSLNTLINILQIGGVLGIVMRYGKFEGYKIRNNVKRYYRYSNPKEIKRILERKGLKWKKTYFASGNKVPYFTILFIKIK